ncbi:uncharacterized protein LOC144446051 [Glandiceps talaboti]
MSWISLPVKKPAPGLTKSEAYDHFNFDYRGIQKNTITLFHPVRSKRVMELAEQSIADAETIASQEDLCCGASEHVQSAVFHALWMYRVTRQFGPVLAKDFGDAYEVTRRSDEQLAERLMDLYNNWMGRVLAEDHENVYRNDIEVVQQALSEDILQLSPDPEYSRGRIQTQEEIEKMKLFSLKYVDKPEI